MPEYIGTEEGIRTLVPDFSDIWFSGPAQSTTLPPRYSYAGSLISSAGDWCPKTCRSAPHDFSISFSEAHAVPHLHSGHPSHGAVGLEPTHGFLLGYLVGDGRVELPSQSCKDHILPLN